MGPIKNRLEPNKPACAHTIRPMSAGLFDSRRVRGTNRCFYEGVTPTQQARWYYPARTIYACLYYQLEVVDRAGKILGRYKMGHTVLWSVLTSFTQISSSIYDVYTTCFMQYFIDFYVIFHRVLCKLVYRFTTFA